MDGVRSSTDVHCNTKTTARSAKSEFYMADAEDNSDETKVQSTPENYAKLCRLFCEVAVETMRQLFNQIHPPDSLVERLAHPSVHKTLRRMRVQEILSQDRWKTLYPKDKQSVNSKRYDPILLYLLLKNVCHISAPYPNGWDELPEDTDHSMGAEVLRLNFYLSTLATISTQVNDKDYKLHFKYITGVLNKLTRSSIGGKLNDVNKSRLRESAAQRKYIEEVKQWHKEAVEIRAKEQKVQQVVSLRSSTEHDLVKLCTHIDGRDSVSTVSDKTRSTASSYGMSSVMSKSVRSRTTLSSMTLSSNSHTKVNLKQLESEIITRFHKHLTEYIASEDVLPKLVQRGVITHEEKNKIQLQTTNVNRMKMILDVVMKKPLGSFDLFCDAIKFKYKGIHILVTEAKRAPFSEIKPDEATELSTALKDHYSEMMTAVPPIPWNRNIQLPLNKVYRKLYITDQYGRTLLPTEIFKPFAKCLKPKRILMQGDSGVGKTTLAKYFLSEWAKKDNEKLHEKIKLAFYVDLKKARNGDVCETLVEQCLPSGCKKTADDIYNIIKPTQKRTLFILDGYEHINSIDDEFIDLIHKNLFKDCYLVVLVKNQFVTSKLAKLFDLKLAVLGLEPTERLEMVKSYTDYEEVSSENLDLLMAELENPEPSAISMLALNPLHCLCLCLIAEQDVSTLDFTTLTPMLQAFITALQKRFCASSELQLPDGSVPESVESLISIFEEIAFESLLVNQFILDVEALASKHKNQDIRHVGFLTPCTNNNSVNGPEDYQFICSVFQEILAARFLLRIELDDFPRYVEQLTTEKHLHTMTVFFCGLQREDFKSETLPLIFETLHDQNLEQWKGCTRRHRAGGDTQTLNREQPEGRLSEYMLSLNCLNECNGRSDAAKLVSQSLPSKIYMKSSDIFDAGTISGFAYVLMENSPVISELDMRLNHLGNYFLHAMKWLAQGIESSAHIEKLKLRWTDEHLLAVFLANTFGDNTSISNIKMYDESKSKKDSVSATVWSNFSSARKKMEFVQTLTFTGCKNPALVSGVIRNAPRNLYELHLNHCSIDMVAAQELNKHLENMACLTTLSLNSAKFNKPDFLSITSGVKHTKSLFVLDLGNTNLDATSTLAVAEALKFNRSLRKLDLSGASFSSQVCRSMGLSLALNKTIQTVNLQGASIPADGKEEIDKMKREGVKIIYDK